MNKDNLGKIINIIGNPATDYKAIAIQVAIAYPTTFLKCAKLSIKEFPMSNVEKAVFPYINGGELINAIKEYRSLTGSGLKEAKDACEALRAKWLQEGKI